MAHEIFIEIQPHYFPEFTLTINLITSITLKDRIESVNQNYLLSIYWMILNYYMYFKNSLS